MRSIVYSRSFAVRLLKRLHLLEGDVDTSEAEFACGGVRVRLGCDEVVDDGMDGAWDTR